MSWSVWITGGRRHSYWCLNYLGPEAEARTKYELLKTGAEARDRHILYRTSTGVGGIQLRDENGIAVATFHNSKAKVI